MSWSKRDKETFDEWVSQFNPITIEVTDDHTHYHFKKRKDMRLAMNWNFNLQDTFSYAGKSWEGKVPTKEQLLGSWHTVET